MPATPRHDTLTSTAIDTLLTQQLAVAWAGESGEEPRLKWWRTDLASEFGGEDLFRRLLPHTWRWAVLEAAREAAKRCDASLRAKDADPDTVLTLFHLGFELDERLDERLADLKRAGEEPEGALPGLKHVLASGWDREAFGEWLAGHGDAASKQTPTGRELKGAIPQGTDRLVARLVAALGPLGETYPMPYVRAPA